MPEASPAGDPTLARDFAAPRFLCTWALGGWGAAWVRAAGELDLATSPQFRRTVSEAQRSQHLLVLDLRELQFIDSSGVHIILEAARHAREGDGRLLIVRGPAQVDKVLTLTGVGKHAIIFDVAADEPAPQLSEILGPEGG